MATKPKPGETFEEWFDRQPGFPNFTGAELARYFHRFRYRNGVKYENGYPPKALWPRFLEVMRVVQMVRSFFDKPTTVTSSYRNKGYNYAVGGVSGSQHLQFRAADIQVKGIHPHRVRDYLLELRRNKVFTGGLGRYNTFTHVDTRGTNATWG